MSFARLVAAGFGIGFAPVVAGTAASAVALLAGAAMLQLSPYALPAAALLATIGGVWAIHAARVEGDPGWVVVDEFAGQWIAMLALHRVTVAGLLVAFVLFRFFDMTKLGPIGWADRRHGAVGIMADDVIAGVISAVLLWAGRTLWLRFVG